MKKRLVAAGAVVALLFACEHTPSGGDATGAMAAAATCTQADCEYVTKNAGNTMLTKYLGCCMKQQAAQILAVCVAVGLGPSCAGVKPPPGGTGGGPAYATGGSTGTGGATNADPTNACIAAKVADALVKNVAKQTGKAVPALAAEICSDPVVLGGYR